MSWSEFNRMKVQMMTMTVKRTMVARFIAVLVCAMTVLGLGNAARAADGVKGEILSVGLGGVRGTGSLYRAGSWVPVRVKVENHTGKNFEGYLAVQQRDMDGDKVFSTKKISLVATLEPREEWLYYWPSPDAEGMTGARWVIVMDMDKNIVSRIGLPGAEFKGATGGAAAGPSPSRAVEPRETNKDSLTSRSARWVVVLGPGNVGMSAYYNAMGGTEGVRYCSLPTAGDLPPHAMGLDGVDVVIWQADRLRVNEFAPEFQMKALQDWTRGGGHLVISVANNWQDFQDATTRLGVMLPMRATGTAELSVADLSKVPGFSRLKAMPEMTGVTQVRGVVKDGARKLGRWDAPFDVHPFAVTMPYGRGVVTLVTVDLSNPEFERQLFESDWTQVWQTAAGWQGDIMTWGQYDYARKRNEEAEQKGMKAPMVLNTGYSEVQLGNSIPGDVDVKDVTQVRVLIAILFLAVYWLAAGPLGYLALRFYNRTHWSWWIFGGTVIVAAGVAGVAVLLLNITSYDVRHKTIVMGTVGTGDASVVGFYGVFAPRSGIVHVELPREEATSESTGVAGSGISYVVPLTPAMDQPVIPFPDPQSYTIEDERAMNTGLVFRRTLKKVQTRWEGQVPGVMVEKAVTIESTGGGNYVFTGSLKNISGFDLERVEIVYMPERLQGAEYCPVFRVADPSGIWPKGATLDLATAAIRETYRAEGGANLQVTLQNVIRAMAEDRASNAVQTHLPFGGGGGGTGLSKDLARGRTEDFLWAFWDAHRPERVVGTTGPRYEVVRNWPRLMDRSEQLRAGGAVIIARAGDVGEKRFVGSPVAVKVDDREIPAKGEVTFLWTLPLVTKNVGGAGNPRLNDGPEKALQPGNKVPDNDDLEAP